MLTEKQAWSYISKLPRSNAAFGLFNIPNSYPRGICGTVMRLFPKCISKNIRERMLLRIREYARKRHVSLDDFIWSECSIFGYKSRVAFCKKQVELLSKRKK